VEEKGRFNREKAVFWKKNAKIMDKEKKINKGQGWVKRQRNGKDVKTEEKKK